MKWWYEKFCWLTTNVYLVWHLMYPFATLTSLLGCLSCTGIKIMTVKFIFSLICFFDQLVAWFWCLINIGPASLSCPGPREINRPPSGQWHRVIQCRIGFFHMFPLVSTSILFYEIITFKVFPLISFVPYNVKPFVLRRGKPWAVLGQVL